MSTNSLKIYLPSNNNLRINSLVVVDRKLQIVTCKLFCRRKGSHLRTTFDIHLSKEYNYISINNISIKKFLYFLYYSTGTGRTGAYIALDYIYKTGKLSGRVNVAEYVKTMRKNRMNMIENYVRKGNYYGHKWQFSEIFNCKNYVYGLFSILSRYITLVIYFINGFERLLFKSEFYMLVRLSVKTLICFVLFFFFLLLFFLLFFFHFNFYILQYPYS